MASAGLENADPAALGPASGVFTDEELAAFVNDGPTDNETEAQLQVCPRRPPTIKLEAYLESSCSQRSRSVMWRVRLRYTTSACRTHPPPFSGRLSFLPFVLVDDWHAKQRVSNPFPATLASFPSRAPQFIAPSPCKG